MAQEYKFYVKASPDGKSLGDCPFTQRANLALKLKKVNYTYILIDLSNKPKWYFEINPAGTAPTLVHGEKIITDSYEILQYLDSIHPNPSLKPGGNTEAEQMTGDVFNMFAAWAKVSQKATAGDAEKKFNAELEKIDRFLGDSEGPLLCGSSWSMADCSLVPRLYHISTVAEHYLNYNKHRSMKNLTKYMDYTFSTPEFKATDYQQEWILSGWKKYFI